MRALRVDIEYYVNAHDIALVQPWKSRAAKREKARAEEARNYYDATGNKPILSLITLKNGWVIASPYQPRTLVQGPVIDPLAKTSTKRTATVLNEETDDDLTSPDTHRVLDSQSDDVEVSARADNEKADKSNQQSATPRRNFLRRLTS